MTRMENESKPPQSFDLTPKVFETALKVIEPHIRHTPLLPLPRTISDMPGLMRFKLENLQVGGSFKARGVFNHLLRLTPEQRRLGVITASGGNHGIALACAANSLNLPATVYLPTKASEDKFTRIASLGAKVFKHGTDWDDANAKALEHAEAEGLYYVHPFDSERTIAGQATLGLELLEDAPDLDCVLIAIGGGGLISGVAAAIKQRKPRAYIIGVEPAGAASMFRSWQAGLVTELSEVRTIADTLAPRCVCERTLSLTRKYVDDIILVEDEAIVEGMRWLWRECNQLVEPAGAAVVAAVMQNREIVADFENPVAVICGGNATVESVFVAYNRNTKRG